MMGRYNSLFGMNLTVLQDPETIGKMYELRGIDRICYSDILRSMFAVHISNLIELPIHDKLKNNRKGADFSEIFLRRCMHMGKLSVMQLTPK